MKTRFKSSHLMYAVLFFVVMLSFSSCEKESLSRSQRASTTSNASQKPDTVHTVITKVPIVFKGFVPCANGGSGENVDETGTGFFNTHVTIKGNNFIMNFHNHSTAETGIGEITGDVYVGKFEEISTQEKGSFTNGEYKTSYILNASSIGKGSVPNLHVRIRVDVVINANGTVTVSTDSFNLTCE